MQSPSYDDYNSECGACTIVETTSVGGWRPYLSQIDVFNNDG